MKPNNRILTALLASLALLGSALLAGTTQAALIAHYSFDVDNTGTTPDSVGSASATLGGGVSINNTTFLAGGGALEMTNSGGTAAVSVDGAVTSNNFSWGSDARTITFWWKAKDPNVNTLQGTYVSFGDTSANGTRFDIKEAYAGNDTVPKGNLRVEVQGTGLTTDPTDFDNGTWQFFALTVPNSATFADISWYVNGSATLNASTNTLDIATGVGPLVFGDSIITSTTTDGQENRTPNGYMDEFQLYDEVLTSEQITFLFENPGSVIPEPSAALLGSLGALLLLRRRR